MIRRAWDLVFETFDRFNEDRVPQLAAAMSFYLLLALAPLLLIVNAIIGAVSRRAMATATAPDQLSGATAAASQAFTQMAAWAGSLAPYATVVLIVFGALEVFGQFVGALEIVWKTPPRPTPVRAFLRFHLLSFVLLGVLALALVVALLVGGIISAFGSLALAYADAMGIAVPSIVLAMLVRGVLVFVTATLLFGVAFKVVPSRKTLWRDLAPGVLATSTLFTAGELWLASFLGNTQRFSVFGTFEFFVVLIVWIYYSALVALWGAELTRLLVLRAEARRDGDSVAAAGA
jgi:membrane protein